MMKQHYRQLVMMMMVVAMLFDLKKWEKMLY